MLSATLVLFASFIALWLLWRKRKFSFFRNLNIPGPEPGIFFGNYWEILHEGQNKCINKWIKRYGRVFGYYYGRRPVIVVADPDLLKIIQQKEFHAFSHRPRLFEVGSSSSDFDKHSVGSVNGKTWKNLRSILTPTFTTSKLKMMNPIVNGAIDELLAAVDRESSKSKVFDIYSLYQNLTLDVIARTSLGVHTNAQNDKNEPFLKLARVVLSFEISYLTMFTFSFPELLSVFSLLRRLLYIFYNQGKHPRAELMEKTYETMKARRRDPNNKRKDLLQLMMDAQKTSEAVSDNNLVAGKNDDSVLNGKMDERNNKTEKTNNVQNGDVMTDEVILHNSGLFLLAGYETTSTALAFTTHLLAHHQDIQDKVREEIRSNISDNKDLTYESVHKLQYLDQVLNESLRIQPPVLYFVNRKGIEDFVVDDVRIPKNVAIQVPVYYMHHDPAFWEEPEKFNPERFSQAEKANRHPMVFQAFGNGPRNCIGMRFAQMEAKMALARLLHKYKVKPKPGTSEDDLVLSKTIATVRPKNGILIEVEKI